MTNHSPEMTDTGEIMLSFDEAMQDFCCMFPHLRPDQISAVLRKYDGDVSSTINELLFDNNPTQNRHQYLQAGENETSVLCRHRLAIADKLRKTQRLLDTVVEVETAREYEDQQLALLLEYREISDRIKSLRTCHESHSSKNNKFDRRVKTKPRQMPVRATRSSEKILVPDGPYIGAEAQSSSNVLPKAGVIKKVSFAGVSRLFSSG